MIGINMNFTEEEIKNLPLELKVGFFLIPWSRETIIDTVEEWLEHFWYFAYTSLDQYNAYTEQDNKNMMLVDYETLYNFVSKCILEEKGDK